MKETVAAPHHPDRLIFREAVEQGHFVHQSDANQYPIPGTLNAVLAVGQIVLSFALLGAASHARTLWGTALVAVAFAFFMQLGFGLPHKPPHSKLHSRPPVTDAL